MWASSQTGKSVTEGISGLAAGTIIYLYCSSVVATVFSTQQVCTGSSGHFGVSTFKTCSQKKILVKNAKTETLMIMLMLWDFPGKLMDRRVLMSHYIYLLIYALLNLIIKLIWSEIKVHTVLFIFNSWIKHMEYLPQTGYKTSIIPNPPGILPL